MAAKVTSSTSSGTHTDRWLGREADSLRQIEVEAARYAAACEDNDFDVAVVIAGEAVEFINDVPPAAIIVERIVSEAARLLGAAAAAPTPAPATD
jgi:nitronate monooxygenase